MFRKDAIIPLILWLLLVAPRSAAQTNPTPLTGADLSVYLITFGPGDAPWEKYGHDCIRVVDHRDNFDASYNYGMFDFEKPGFISDFVQGRMTYWMDADETTPMVDYYISQNRAVWMQELNLADEQKLGLFAFLENNRRPENKFYKYDYFRDNCASRVRDALDRAAGGQINQQLQLIHTQNTYRDHTRIGMAGVLYLYAGLNLSLGHLTDRPLNAWEECYIPERLRDYLNEVKVPDISGKMVPLVKRSQLLGHSTRAPLPTRPPNYSPWFLLAGIVLGAAIVAARKLRRTVTLLICVWSLLAGLAGIFLTFVLFTDHQAAYWNENLFQFTPLSLLLILLLPVALFRDRWRPMVRWLAVIITGLALLGLIGKALPSMRQPNWDFVLLALPLHLSACAAIWSAKLYSRKAPAPADNKRSKRT